MEKIVEFVCPFCSGSIIHKKGRAGLKQESLKTDWLEFWIDKERYIFGPCPSCSAQVSGIVYFEKGKYLLDFEDEVLDLVRAKLPAPFEADIQDRKELCPEKTFFRTSCSCGVTFDIGIVDEGNLYADDEHTDEKYIRVKRASIPGSGRDCLSSS